MIDHVSFPCSDLTLSQKFYDAVLSSLGYVRVWSTGSAHGYGTPGAEDKFAIKVQTAVNVPGPGFHVAFSAPNRESVDRFYEAALAHGGADKGAPGLRPHYGPTYYAAFVLDPDGHHIEAVCHQ